MTIDAKTIKEGVAWLLEKGTVWTCVVIFFGALAFGGLTLAEPRMMTAGYKHEAIDDLKIDLAVAVGALGFATVIYELRKNRKMNAQIEAARVMADPSNPLNLSPVAEVRSELAKLDRESRDEGIRISKSGTQALPIVR